MQLERATLVGAMSAETDAPRSEPPDGQELSRLVRCYHHTLELCAPEALLTRSLRTLPGLEIASLEPYLSVDPLENRPGFRRETPHAIEWPEGNIHLLAVGKSAGACAAGFRAGLGEKLHRCLVVAPPGADVPEASDGKIEVLRGEHPIPGAGSEYAGQRVLEFTEEVHPADLLIVCLSGGASALMVAPVEDITLEDLSETNRALLASGAPIEVINVVRGQLSRIKNGRLARACKGELVSVVLSDVGGGPEVVGSGPTLSRRVVGV
ncbi:MAG: glycerate-2-kinase family protein [Myxococcota bacterium]